MISKAALLRRNMCMAALVLVFAASPLLAQSAGTLDPTFGVGGKLKLCNIRPQIYEVFAITKLNKLFEIRENQDDAVAAF